MSEPILENEETKIEKRKRKPLSDEDKKRQLENLRKGREMAHQKRRELEAMAKKMKEQETLKKDEVVACPPLQPVELHIKDTKVDNVSVNTKKEKKKKIVYVDEESSSSEEEVIIRRKKPTKQVIIKEQAPPPPPPKPKVDIEAERQKRIALLQQQKIAQRKQAQKQQYMTSIFGD